MMKFLSLLSTSFLSHNDGYSHPMRVLFYSTAIYTLCSIALSFVVGYVRARRTGLKIVVSPLTPYTLTWRIATSVFEPILQQYRWYRAIDWTCCWQDGHSLHEELGESFLVVSPGLTVLCTSDVTTYEAVLKGWREFEKPDNVNEILGTFGRNVDTSNGDNWPRHRKIVAPSFSERASSKVWNEALGQTEGFVSQWLKKRNMDVAEGMSTLALNVISAVAFENHQVNEVAKGHTMSLKEALTTVMSTSISPALEGIMSWLNIPALRMLMPTKIQSLMIAMKEFRQYMDELILRERNRPETEKEVGKSEMNLIQTLIKANTGEEAKLSDNELRGNIFIFTVGGLESTSATLTYALSLLSIHPSIQDWVAEEIVHLSQDGEIEYAKIFPKLTRVKAVMFETLRLFSPSPPLPRTSRLPGAYFTLPTSTGPISLHTQTQIMLNTWSSHVLPRHFPNEPAKWDPKRWIQTSPSPSTTKDGKEGETLVHHPGFYPWGAGPRICPGMKFSQVQFCAVLVGVLGKTRLVGEKGVVNRVLTGSVSEPLLLHVEGEVRVEVVRRLGGDGA